MVASVLLSQGVSATALESKLQFAQADSEYYPANYGYPSQRASRSDPYAGRTTDAGAGFGTYQRKISASRPSFIQPRATTGTPSPAAAAYARPATSY